MTPVEIGVIVFISLLILYALYFLIKTIYLKHELKGSLYRSVVGRGNTKGNQNTLNHKTNGDDLKLSCPVDTKINIDQIYINGDSPLDLGNKKCWVALSESGPGYPMSGLESSNTKYSDALRALKKKHDGVQTTTIKNDEQHLVDIVDQYLNYYSELSDCDESDGSKKWTPLISVRYECK